VDLLPDGPAEAAEVLFAGAGEVVVVTDVDREPGVDAAVGSALLDLVIARPDAPWLRLYRTAPTVGFSGRDLLAPGLPVAVDACRDAGFAPVRRAPGGHAAAYHRQTLCFDLVIPPGIGTPEVQRQLAALSVLVQAVLVQLGVDARIGAVPDEYCPGQYSINREGREKVVGTAARRRSNGTLIGALCPVGDPDPLRAVIGDVYRALEMPCDVGTVGTLGLTCEPFEVGAALVSAVDGFVPVTVRELPAEVVAAADHDRADLVGVGRPSRGEPGFRSLLT
jgi:octanoyl-[GcvH]:protein N-octanoyltransferase